MPSIVWKGQLTFGLVSIPVKLYRAARRERVRMHYVHRAEVSEKLPDEPDEVSPAEGPLRSEEQALQRLEAFTPRTQPERKAAAEPATRISRVHQSLVTPEGVLSVKVRDQA